MLRQANRKPDHAVCMGEGIVSPRRLLHLAKMPERGARAYPAPINFEISDSEF